MLNNKTNDTTPSYEEAISVLMVREKELDARENQMKRNRQALDDDLLAADGNETSPSDVLHLNIGGTKTTSIPGSMLASKFSERWDDSIEKNKPIGPKAGPTCASLFDLLDDPILREIIAFLPDPETVCTLGGCCLRLNNLVEGETVIWDRFLEQIPARARPKHPSDHTITPEPRRSS